MDMNMNQRQQQEQRLILTTEMKMSLNLLLMPLNDLQEYIEKEIDENPLLDIDYNTDEAAEPENKEVSEVFDEAEELDYENLIQLLSPISYQGENSFSNNYGDENNPFHYISQATSLKDYLKEQLNDRDDKRELHDVGEYLIECINKDGFIIEDIKDISVIIRKPYGMVCEALGIIRDFQPWGIGAKDFRESLIIQLKKRNMMDENVHEIISKHLELLAENRLKEVAKILGIKVEEVQKYVNIIKTLEPKPARGFFTGEETGYIVPEAFIKKIGTDYYITMNDDMLPRLNVNYHYRNIIKGDSNEEVIRFIKEKEAAAVSLIKGIDQRRNTIYRIIEKMIEYQKEYFDKDDSYLKPMILKDISVELSLHQSTISRAMKDKYISTPRGTIRMKDLFTNGMNNTAPEENISTNIVKKEIKKIINTEDKHKPLSDLDICEMLSKSGFHISRRTVAKYREELGIKPSSKRKIYL